MKKTSSLINTFLLFSFSAFFLSFKDSKQATSAIEPVMDLTTLADVAFKDALSKQIVNKEIDIFLKANFFRRDVRMLNDINSKANWNDQEKDFILQQYGFDGSAEFVSYCSLLETLFLKYQINILEKNDQKIFISALKEKQKNYVLENQLLQKRATEMSTTLASNPECWKCVYDYRDCMRYANGHLQIISTDPDFVSLLNSSGKVILSTASDASFTTMLYTLNDGFTPEECAQFYENCMSSCEN
ncbi:MAG: hypothetical protein ACTHMM_15000 [Agriterribacter sp.]